MEPFQGSIDDLLEKVSKLSKKELDQIEVDSEKSASISFICKELDCSLEEAEEVYQEILKQEVKKGLEELLEEGLIEVVGYNEDGEPLYDLKKK
jgi:tRNA threonylcarbamoyladenosine modification (KEOPS) complex Cgi121 subunit